MRFIGSILVVSAFAMLHTIAIADDNVSAPAPSDYTPPTSNGSHDPEGFYPPVARAKKEQGRAYIEFTVRTDGSVAEPSLMKSTGFDDLDMAAIQTIESWRYKPATIGGKPVEARWHDYVDFSLVGVAIPPGVKPPQANSPHEIGSFYPVYARRHNEQGRIVVIFTVQEDGSVTDPAVKESSGFADLDDAALQAVKTWRYLPATKDGNPVAVHIAASVGFYLIEPVAECKSLRC